MQYYQKIQLFFVCLATCLFTIDMGVISVSLPHMRGTFSATRTEIAWILTVFTIATAVSITSLGFLSRKFGRKRVYIVGIIGFTLTSGLCGTSYSLEYILFLRALQGAFGATLVALSQAIILDTFNVEHRNRALSFWTLGLLAGPVIGPLLGGYLTEYYGWRWIFFINIPLGITAAVGVSIFMKTDTPNKVTNIDYIGFILLGTFATSLQLVLDRGQLEDWFSSSKILILTIISTISFVFFTIRILSFRNPIIPKGLFTDRSYVAGLVFVFLFGIILIPPFVLMPIFLSELSKYPLHLIGLTICPSGIGGMISTFFTSKIISEIGYKKTMILGLGLYIFSSIEFAFWTPDISNLRIMLNGIFRGAGISIYYVGLASATYVTLPVNLRTEGATLFQFFRNFGSGIAVAVLITLLERYSQINYEELGSRIIKGSQHWNVLKSLKDQGLTKVSEVEIIANVIGKEAVMNALINDFLILGIIPLCFMPLLFLFKKEK